MSPHNRSFHYYIKPHNTSIKLTILVYKPFLSYYSSIKLLVCESSLERKMSWSGGDWMCGACEHINFKKREACQSCGYPKYGGPDPSTYRYSRTETLAGDWFCTAMNCGAHNYASRSNCYRCGSFKNDYSSGYGSNMAGSGGYGSDCSSPPGWKSGDWICPRTGCGMHNYASRTECYKCKMPRDYGGAD